VYMRIGELAKQLGIATSKIRFLESRASFTRVVFRTDTAITIRNHC
jgi:hypothetical protein